VRDAPVIAIVDDDDSFREALEGFLGTFAFRVRTFASGEEFLQSRELGFLACLLLGLVMPGMSGLEVKQQLGARSANPRLVAAGAIAMLPKPVNHRYYFAWCKA
jgi:FixJ family two-component response regulator